MKPSGELKQDYKYWEITKDLIDKCISEGASRDPNGARRAPKSTKVGQKGAQKAPRGTKCYGFRCALLRFY